MALKLNIYEELMIAYYLLLSYLITYENDKLAIVYRKKLERLMSKIDNTIFYYRLYSNRTQLLKKADV